MKNGSGMVIAGKPCLYHCLIE